MPIGEESLSTCDTHPDTQRALKVSRSWLTLATQQGKPVRGESQGILGFRFLIWPHLGCFCCLLHKARTLPELAVPAGERCRGAYLPMTHPIWGLLKMMFSDTWPLPCNASPSKTQEGKPKSETCCFRPWADLSKAQRHCYVSKHPWYQSNTHFMRQT